MKNKYVERSKISAAKFRELVRYFPANLPATQIAGFTGLSRATANRYLMGMHKAIHAYCTDKQRIEAGAR